LTEANVCPGVAVRVALRTLAGLSERLSLVLKALQRGKRAEADGETRTPDPIITSDVLYQLSYVGGCAQGKFRTS
jgi:hypothetical protein